MFWVDFIVVMFKCYVIFFMINENDVICIIYFVNIIENKMD